MSFFLLIEKVPNLNGRGFEPQAASLLAILECASPMLVLRAISRDKGTDAAGQQYVLNVRDETDTRREFPAALPVVSTVEQLHDLAIGA